MGVLWGHPCVFEQHQNHYNLSNINYEVILVNLIVWRCIIIIGKERNFEIILNFIPGYFLGHLW